MSGSSLTECCSSVREFTDRPVSATVAVVSGGSLIGCCSSVRVFTDSVAVVSGSSLTDWGVLLLLLAGVCVCLTAVFVCVLQVFVCVSYRCFVCALQVFVCVGLTGVCGCLLQVSHSPELQDVLKFVGRWCGATPNPSYSFQ